MVAVESAPQGVTSFFGRCFGLQRVVEWRVLKVIMETLVMVTDLFGTQQFVG